MCCLFRNLCNSCGNTRSNSCWDNDVEMRIVNASNGCGCGWNHGGSVVVISNGGCGCGCNSCNGYGYNTASTCGCAETYDNYNGSCNSCGCNY